MPHDDVRFGYRRQPGAWPSLPAIGRPRSRRASLGVGAGMALNPVLLAAMGEVNESDAGLASGIVNTPRS
jgi:hypothetical protein